MRGASKGQWRVNNSNQQEALQIKQELVEGGVKRLKGKMGRGVPLDCAAAGLWTPNAAA